jgi:hypothetical protein
MSLNFLGIFYSNSPLFLRFSPLFSAFLEFRRKYITYIKKAKYKKMENIYNLHYEAFSILPFLLGFQEIHIQTKLYIQTFKKEEKREKRRKTGETKIGKITNKQKKHTKNSICSFAPLLFSHIYY